MSNDRIPIGKAEDLTGKKFNKLTALYRTHNKGRHTTWVCQCECGTILSVQTEHLKSGHTTSCGCKVKERINNIIGQKFGKLTVLRPLEERASNRGIIWECQCECGAIVTARSDYLHSGRAVTCGSGICRGTEKDMTGLKFGKLIVISKSDYKNNSSNHTYWNCQCECGNKCVVSGVNLRMGNTVSCGCITSKGEQLIGHILTIAKIPYQTQKTFESCRFTDTHALAKFDFYINNCYLIEFDGRQHYEYEDSGWSTEENYLKTQQHDEFKNNWCKENNIPLIRIPYTKFDTLRIEDLMLETTEFRIV